MAMDPGAVARMQAEFQVLVESQMHMQGQMQVLMDQLSRMPGNQMNQPLQAVPPTLWPPDPFINANYANCPGDRMLAQARAMAQQPQQVHIEHQQNHMRLPPPRSMLGADVNNQMPLPPGLMLQPSAAGGGKEPPQRNGAIGTLSEQQHQQLVGPAQQRPQQNQQGHNMRQQLQVPQNQQNQQDELSTCKQNQVASSKQRHKKEKNTPSNNGRNATLQEQSYLSVLQHPAETQVEKPSSSHEITRQARDTFPSSDEVEARESISGKCTTDSPTQISQGVSTRSGELSEEGGQMSKQISPPSSDDNFPGGMSVATWRQSRTHADEVAETSVAEAFPLQAVLAVMGQLSKDPSKTDLVREISQAVPSLMLSGPETSEQIKASQLMLANCLRTAAAMLLQETETLSRSTATIAGPVALTVPEQSPLFVGGGPLLTEMAQLRLDQSGKGSVPAAPGLVPPALPPVRELPLLVPQTGFNDTTAAPRRMQNSQMDGPYQAGLATQVANMRWAPLPPPTFPPGIFDPGAYNAASVDNPTPMVEMPKPMTSLCLHLREVEMEDPACIVVAKGIQSLGFHSKKKLREHFCKYGEVVRVLVPNTKLKAAPDTNGQLGRTKMRPGTKGLIVMKSAESVRKIVRLGEEQFIEGHQVHVERFDAAQKTEDMTSKETLCDYSQSDGGSGSTGDSTGLRRGSGTFTGTFTNDSSGVSQWSRQGSNESGVSQWFASQ